MRDDVVRDAVAEVLVRGIIAHVGERQHGDRAPVHGRDCHGGGILAGPPAVARQDPPATGGHQGDPGQGQDPGQPAARARLSDDRVQLVSGRGAFALHALGRELERPRQRQHHRKTEHRDERDHRGHGVGKVQGRHQEVGSLHHGKSGGAIYGRNLEDTPPLQFGEEPLYACGSIRHPAPAPPVAGSPKIRLTRRSRSPRRGCSTRPRTCRASSRTRSR